MEYWSIGGMEYWSIGVLEGWHGVWSPGFSGRVLSLEGGGKGLLSPALSSRGGEGEAPAHRLGDVLVPCRFRKFPRIPKGFRPGAQGCEPRATLGKAGGVGQPQRDCGPMAERGTTPLGLKIARTLTQGSSRLATRLLGWRTQSLWDCSLSTAPFPAIRICFGLRPSHFGSPAVANRRWRRYSQIFMEEPQELSRDSAGAAMSPFNSLKLHIFLICVHLRNLRSTSVAF